MEDNKANNYSNCDLYIKVQVSKFIYLMHNTKKIPTAQNAHAQNCMKDLGDIPYAETDIRIWTD